LVPRLILLLPLLLVLPLAPGCGLDVGDLNRRILVYALGVDSTPSGATSVSILYASPTGTSATQGATLGTASGNYVVQEASAEGEAAALARLTRAASGRLWLGSLRIVVFGERLAQKGLGNALAWLMVLPEVPDRTCTVVVRGRAADFLRTPSLPAGNAAAHVVEMLDGQGPSELAARGVPFYRLFDQAFRATGSLFVPLFEARSGQVAEAGLATFRGGRLVAEVPPSLASLFASITASGPGTVELPGWKGLPPLHLRARRLVVRAHLLGGGSAAPRLLVRIDADGVTFGEESAALAKDPERLFRLKVAARLRDAFLAELRRLTAAGADPLDVGERLRERSPDGEAPPYETVARTVFVVAVRVRQAAVPIGT